MSQNPHKTLCFPHERAYKLCFLISAEPWLDVIFNYLLDEATLFIIIFLFHRLVLGRVHFTYSNFAWGLHGGVGVKWSGGVLVLELHRRDCGKG